MAGACPQSDGDVNSWRARVYAFASYLIACTPESNATFYYSLNELTPTWLPEWTLDLGDPIETYTTLQGYKNIDNQVFSRRFAHAVVVVNPYGTATGMIPLPKAYSDVQLVETN